MGRPSVGKPIIVGVIQARMGSARFPGKMMSQLGGFPLVEWVLRRVRKSLLLDRIVLATSTGEENGPLEKVASSLAVETFRGDEQNVLSRFAAIAESTRADVVVRICGDNPFICPAEIDRVIRLYLENKPDYAFNHIPRMENDYVDGLGAEVLSGELLRHIASSTKEQRYTEHVTMYIWDHMDSYKIMTVKAPAEFAYPDVVLDVNEPDDISFLEANLYGSGRETVNPEDYDARVVINNILANKGPVRHAR